MIATRYSASLFDAAPGGRVAGDAVGWLTGTMLGAIAITLCILAVASVGAMMFTGRLPIRRGAQVVLGCFILLGAPVIASALFDLGGPVAGAQAEAPNVDESAKPREDLPPAEYDPYAGASLRRN